MTRVRAEMPTIEIPRGRGWIVAILGLAILVAAVAFMTIVDARTPSGYRGRHMSEAEWVYPASEVRFWLGVMVGEGLIAGLLLFARMKFSIGARALLLSGLFFCGMLALAPFAMHADSTFIDHLIWMFFASVFLLLFALGSAIANAIVRHREREAALR